MWLGHMDLLTQLHHVDKELLLCAWTGAEDKLFTGV